jgi:hypothetical protein
LHKPESNIDFNMKKLKHHQMITLISIMVMNALN